MGAGAPGFTEQSIRFHHTADRIAEAARGKQRAKVLGELGTPLQTCPACHAVWKQRVVDDIAGSQATAVHPTPENEAPGAGSMVPEGEAAITKTSARDERRLMPCGH